MLGLSQQRGQPLCPLGDHDSWDQDLLCFHKNPQCFTLRGAQEHLEMWARKGTLHGTAC